MFLCIGSWLPNFNVYSDIRQGFDVLTQLFVKELIAIFNPYFAVEQCKLYCNQHWHDEKLNSSLCSVSSISHLFFVLKSSPLYNFLSTKLLRYLANVFGITKLTLSLEMYEERINSLKLQDLPFIKEVKVTGENIPEQDHALVVSAILEHGITIGQLQEMCTPRYLHLYNTVILNFGRDLPDFYYFIKVNHSHTIENATH